MSDLVRLFEEHKNKKIAIYGLGIESEKAIKALNKDFEIIGLLDGFREDGSLYGKPVISLQDAIDKRIALVIVVARPGSCRAIVKRIGDICRQNKVALMDIRGKDLLAKGRVTYNFLQIPGATKAKLSELINEAEVVSFDLFDTLVMRRALSFDDVPELVNCKLEEQGIFIKDFCRRRIASEKKLSKEMAPTLTAIYDNMLAKLDDKSDIRNITAEELANLEWKIDYELLVPRQEVCDIFRKAVADKKAVYVVSDTYYSRNQLSEILSKCGITEYTDILSSNEYGTGKRQKLYGILKNKKYGKKCIHIGDDTVADIECAASWGIETFRLWSGIDLLEAVGNLGLAEYMDELSDRLKIGMFISRIFNSPFQFETQDRCIRVLNAHDIGYIFCAPIISDFVCWFHRQVKEQNLENIWFCARDGYLIKKLYEHLLILSREQRETVYFLTSRIASIRAGMQSEKDIRYVDDMKFSGTLEECLLERFGIEIKGIAHTSISNDEEGLLKYKEIILEKANKERRNYRRYIEKIGLRKGNIAFFDFVAKGTCQMYVQRLVKNSLRGLYFLQLEPKYMKEKGLDIQSFYSHEELETSAVYDNYYILETLLTAPHPSVSGFDESGAPIYARENRSSKDMKCFHKAQEGVCEYFETYFKLCPKAVQKENKKLDEVFLSLIHDIQIMDEAFLSQIIEDPFFNRMTNITDVL